MEANPARIIEYFNGEKQSLVPLFQRPYTWKKDHWSRLWEDIMVQYDQDDNAGHFLGAIVTIPARTVPVVPRSRLRRSVRSASRAGCKAA